MKLLFISNYCSHHQKPLCDAWFRRYGGDFAFIATEAMPDQRKAMHWPEYEALPYALSREALPEAVEKAEMVVLGHAPLSLVQSRLKAGKPVLRYAERVFKSGYFRSKWLPRLLSYHWRYGRHRSLYLLAAGAYAAGDYHRHGAFLGKSYQWGYFPETRCYDVEQLLNRKERTAILWCGRLISWKHPEAALELACRLKESGYDFSLDIIGTGEMEAALQQQIAARKLSDRVHLLGAMPPDRVRACMEKAGIFLLTSDFQEGWGAVVNEAMNSGCAVVASHAAGAVPWLIQQEKNGLIYENGDLDTLFSQVKALLDSPVRQKELGRRAYETITVRWNAEVAAERFALLAQDLAERGKCMRYSSGPGSPAPTLKNNWYSREEEERHEPDAAPNGLSADEKMGG